MEHSTGPFMPELTRCHVIDLGQRSFEDALTFQRRLVDERHVFQYRTTGWRIAFVQVPVGFVELRDFFEAYIFDGQALTQLNKPTDVPRQ